MQAKLQVVSTPIYALSISTTSTPSLEESFGQRYMKRNKYIGKKSNADVLWR